VQFSSIESDSDTAQKMLLVSSWKKETELNLINAIKLRRTRGVGQVARMGKMRNSYRFSVLKPQRKRPLGRPRRKWERGIRMDLRKILEGGGMWTGSG
jgi:hypothetical protein